jgi:hypothetical protein
MPPARKSPRHSSRRSTTFKEPAALKRLNRSLDVAQQALTELRTHAGRSAAQNKQTLHKGLGKFLSDARRDTGKFTTALKRDFESAQKAMASAPAQRSRASGVASRRSTRRTPSKGSARKSA